MVKILLSIVLCISASAETIKLDEGFLLALRKTETAGQKNFGIDAVGKNGELGPYQITYAYWLDAKRFDKTIGGSYKECGQKEYSERIVTAYLNCYAPNACRNKNYEVLARTHNNGPRVKPSSIVYWKRFCGFLTK
jgi:hypothetical protein